MLAGGFKYVLFPPLLGEMIQFDDHIFQMGWFNHHLDFHLVDHQAQKGGQLYRGWS